MSDIERRRDSENALVTAAEVVRDYLPKELKLAVQIFLGIGAGLVAYSGEGSGNDAFNVVGALIVALIVGWAAGLFITTRPA